LSAWACAFCFENRPLLFTHLLMAFLLLMVSKYAKAMAAKDLVHARYALVGAALSAILCSHVHAGSAYLFIILLCVACGAAGEPVRARLLKVEPLVPCGPGVARDWTLATVAAVLISAATLELYHPIGARILLFPFDMATDAYLAEHLVEFRPPHRFPAQQLAGLWVLIAAIVLALLTGVRSLHLAWLGLLVVFLALALRHVRLAFALSVVSTPLLAVVLTRLADRHVRRLHGRRRLLGVLFICLAIAAPLHNWQRLVPAAQLSTWTWPTQHFAFIRELHLTGHAYLSVAWAGPYLGFFYPERRSFFDNRIDAHSRAFFRDVYQSVRSGRAGWDRELDRHDVEIVLMRYTTEGEARFQDGAPNLRQRLVTDRRWMLVRFDDVGELFVRADGLNARVARKLGIAGVDPDRRFFLGRPRQAAAALMRSVTRDGRSSRLLAMTAVAVADDGRRPLADRLMGEARRLAPADAWLDHVATRIEQLH